MYFFDVVSNHDPSAQANPEQEKKAHTKGGNTIKGTSIADMPLENGPELLGSFII
jgi:hypothetical protein